MLEFVGENSDLRAEWQRRVVRLRENHDDGPVEAQNALINLGPCIFLNEASTCEVYQARPDACRACHVWHTAEHCGREDYDMCTPAELNALRVDRIHQLMLEELNLDRRPFWGQLLPMIDLHPETETEKLVTVLKKEAVDERAEEGPGL